MEADRAALGRLGEDVALLLLASRGYALVARNVRCGRREIDLVVERGTLLVAVEVKWRTARDPDTFAPGEAWSRPQRARAHEAMLLALGERFGGADRPWRFDLVTIVARPRGWVVEHRPGAWAPASSWW